jgi:hypothetical protein
MLLLLTPQHVLWGAKIFENMVAGQIFLLLEEGRSILPCVLPHDV